MSRAQYFTLLHFFNQLQNIRKEAILSNDVRNNADVLKLTVPIQDILANDNLKRHGEKRKMPLENGHEDPVAQPSKRIKLENGLYRQRVLPDNDVDSSDYQCPVCPTRFSREGIPKAGIQMRFHFEWI